MQPGQPFRRQPGRAQHGTRHAQRVASLGLASVIGASPAAADD